MLKKIVLAGGTGFIGQCLERTYTNQGYIVHIISRQPGQVSWHDEQALIQALEGAEMVINLAGRSVNCRYTEKNKREISESRTRTTEALGQAIQKCQNPPDLWINSSTATIYRHAEDRPMTESTGELGSGFSVDVGKAWEDAFFDFQLPKTRQVALRLAIVLGADGGVMEPYINLVRFGLGGKQGDGRQRFSWIHIEDVCAIIAFLKGRKDLSGIFNASAPTPVTNQEFMEELRRAMGRRTGLPAPEWMLGLGAMVIGTETELILKSRWVLPERLQKAGFRFHYDRLDRALWQILQEQKQEQVQ
ncbi:TIGR01777 family oxidoreductase [Planococcus salinarum]|uniref:TIGR01777 family oxidoreductase n=1 Tax=Planococcus salinarum TaxID=622695 RepID=UPI000E3DD221|nr:TIGR01777 family oxidoreductase [Planococcus salinarum]TAA71714.1 TIGR01777 family protein [Planococcus salinarum]